MENNTQMTVPQVNSFIRRMAERERTNVRQAPKPSIVSMNGNTGIFSIDRWDATTKQHNAEPLGGSFTGSIVAVKYFCQSKYKEGARKFWKTKEFSSWTVPVTLQCIDQDSEPKVQDVSTYPTYKEFKKARTLVDQDTGEDIYNYALHASLYVYMHSLDQVVCFQSKVGGNNGLFDYFRSYQVGNDAEALVQAKTVFSSAEEVSETLKNEDGTPKKFFSLQFATEGLNSDAELQRLEEIVNELDRWFAPQEETKTQVVVLPAEHKAATHLDALKAAKMVEEPSDAQMASDKIPLDQIPF